MPGAPSAPEAGPASDGSGSSSTMASTSSSERIPWECLDQLVRGSPLLKFGRLGDPHFRHFQLSTDCQVLSWFSHKKETSDSKVRLRECRLLEGQQTDVFRRQGRSELADWSFSLVYEDPKAKEKAKGKAGGASGSSTAGGKVKLRTLDVTCKDRREYEAWATALRYLVKTTPPPGLLELRRKTQWADIEQGGAGWDGSGDFQAKSSVLKQLNSSIKRGLKARLKETCDLYSMGDSAWGQLGMGDSSPFLPLPTLVSSLLGKAVRLVSCGSQHALAVTESGETYAMGHGGSGRLGTGSTSHETSPRLLLKHSGGASAFAGAFGSAAAAAAAGGVSEPWRFKLVACGDKHSLGIGLDGKVYAWGCGMHGATGLASKEDALEPTLVPFFAAFAYSDSRGWEGGAGGAGGLSSATAGEASAWHGSSSSSSSSSSSLFLPHGSSSSEQLSSQEHKTPYSHPHSQHPQQQRAIRERTNTLLKGLGLTSSVSASLHRAASAHSLLTSGEKDSGGKKDGGLSSSSGRGRGAGDDEDDEDEEQDDYEDNDDDGSSSVGRSRSNSTASASVSETAALLASAVARSTAAASSQGQGGGGGNSGSSSTSGAAGSSSEAHSSSSAEAGKAGGSGSVSAGPTEPPSHLQLEAPSAFVSIAAGADFSLFLDRRGRLFSCGVFDGPLGHHSAELLALTEEPATVTAAVRPLLTAFVPGGERASGALLGQLGEGGRQLQQAQLEEELQERALNLTAMVRAFAEQRTAALQVQQGLAMLGGESEGSQSLNHSMSQAHLGMGGAGTGAGGGAAAAAAAAAVSCVSAFDLFLPTQVPVGLSFLLQDLEEEEGEEEQGDEEVGMFQGQGQEETGLRYQQQHHRQDNEKQGGRSRNSNPFLVDSVTAIAAGQLHAACCSSSGVLYTWGWNEAGQLGLGDTQEREVPTPLTTLPGKALSVACGGAHTLAVTEVIPQPVHAAAEEERKEEEGEAGADGLVTVKSPLLTVGGGTTGTAAAASKRAGGSSSAVLLPAGSSPSAPAALIQPEKQLFGWGSCLQGQVPLELCAPVSAASAAATVLASSPFAGGAKQPSAGRSSTSASPASLFAQAGRTSAALPDQQAAAAAAATAAASSPISIPEDAETAAAVTRHNLLPSQPSCILTPRLIELPVAPSSQQGQGAGQGQGLHLYGKGAAGAGGLPPILEGGGGVTASVGGGIRALLSGIAGGSGSGGKDGSSGGVGGVGSGPAVIPFPSRPAPTSISCGLFHSAVVTEDGSVYVMGGGKRGELGLQCGRLQEAYARARQNRVEWRLAMQAAQGSLSRSIAAAAAASGLSSGSGEGGQGKHSAGLPSSSFSSAAPASGGLVDGIRSLAKRASIAVVGGVGAGPATAGDSGTASASASGEDIAAAAFDAAVLEAVSSANAGGRSSSFSSTGGLGDSSSSLLQGTASSAKGSGSSRGLLSPGAGPLSSPFGGSSRGLGGGVVVPPTLNSAASAPDFFSSAAARTALVTGAGAGAVEGGSGAAKSPGWAAPAASTAAVTGRGKGFSGPASASSSSSASASALGDLRPRSLVLASVYAPVTHQQTMQQRSTLPDASSGTVCDFCHKHSGSSGGSSVPGGPLSLPSVPPICMCALLSLTSDELDIHRPPSPTYVLGYRSQELPFIADGGFNSALASSSSASATAAAAAAAALTASGAAADTTAEDSSVGKSEEQGLWEALGLQATMLQEAAGSSHAITGAASSKAPAEQQSKGGVAAGGAAGGAAKKESGAGTGSSAFSASATAAVAAGILSSVDAGEAAFTSVGIGAAADIAAADGGLAALGGSAGPQGAAAGGGGAAAGSSSSSSSSCPLASTLLYGPLPLLPLQGREVRSVCCGAGFTFCTVATEWMRDDETKVCIRCNSAFSLYLRRHHCRSCGGLFCQNCCSKRVPLLKLGHIEPVRVCDACYAKQTTDG